MPSFFLCFLIYASLHSLSGYTWCPIIIVWSSCNEKYESIRILYVKILPISMSVYLQRNTCLHKKKLIRTYEVLYNIAVRRVVQPTTTLRRSKRRKCQMLVNNWCWVCVNFTFEHAHYLSKPDRLHYYFSLQLYLYILHIENVKMVLIRGEALISTAVDFLALPKFCTLNLQNLNLLA